MTTLVVAAHPDDEVLGCGGTIAKLVNSGETVYIAILGEGATSRFASRADAGRAGVDSLVDAARQVAAYLRVEDLALYGLSDNRFDGLDLLDIVKIIEDLIAQWTPSVIYTHHGADLNIDHSIVHRAVVTATRPWASPGVSAVYSFEIPSATEWSFNQFARPFAPTVFHDISGTMATKLKAMSIYSQELRPFPHPRSPENLEALAVRWGAVAGVQRAEAFELIREIRS